MKYIKCKLTVAIFLLSTSCFATLKPKACPEVAALKSVGMQNADTSLIGWQVSSDENNFGTNETWKFVMLMVDDKSQSEAEVVKKANDKISSLVLFSGPEMNNRDWLCTYRIFNGNDPIIGIAGTKA